MSERKPRLEWRLVKISDFAEEEYCQWQAHVGELFDLFADDSTEDEPAAQWSVYHFESDIEWVSALADDAEAGKLAAEDYAFAELVKAVASFGATIVDSESVVQA